MVSLIYGMKKIKGTSEDSKRETDTDIENKPVVTTAERQNMGRD